MKLVREAAAATIADDVQMSENGDDDIFSVRDDVVANLNVKRAVQMERLHPLLQNDEQMASDSPWTGHHLPYTIVGTLLAAVALAAVLVSDTFYLFP